MRRRVSCLLLVLSGVLLLAPAGAHAVTVSRAELSGSTLRLEGRGAAPNVQVRVTAIPSTHMALGTADGSGAFRVESSNFRSGSCKVDVSDGGRTADALGVTLSGCTPATTTPPPPPPPTEPAPPPPPPSPCTLHPHTEPFTGNVGTFMAWFATTTGCRTSNGPVRVSIVAGRIPPGTATGVQGVGSPRIAGTPTTAGTYDFTMRVTDNAGASDTESFRIVIGPPTPLVINNQSMTLTPGTVGQFYCCGNLFALGGTTPYSWTLRAGVIPPGLSLQRSPGRITGTPTRAGTYAFTLRVTDARGAFTEGTFTIVVS